MLWLKSGATYEYSVEALPSGVKAIGTISLANVTPPPVDPPPPNTTKKYGYMVFLGNGTEGVDKDIQGIVDAGGTWARLGMFDSGSIDNNGVFQPDLAKWAHFEYACKRAREKGLKGCGGR